MSDASEGTSVAATDSNILEVVDGEGQKPFLGNAQFGDEAPEGTEPVGAESEPVLAQDIDMPAADPDAVDPLAEAERLLSEPEVPEETDDFDDDLEIPDEDRDKPIGRAARTIRDLRKRAQTAEQQVQQLNTQNQQFMAWADDMTRRYQFLEERLTRPQQPQRPEPGEAPLDPNDPEYAVKKFKRDLMQELTPQFEQMRAGDRREIAALKQQLAQREQMEQRQQVSSRYNYVADQAASSLTAGFDPEVAPKLNRPLGTLILNAAYGWKTDPGSAAKVLDRVMTDYVLAKLRARHTATKQKVQASKNAPAVPTPGRGAPNTRGNALPTRKEVEASGAKDELDLMFQRGGFRRAQ